MRLVSPGSRSGLGEVRRREKAMMQNVSMQIIEET